MITVARISSCYLRIKEKYFPVSSFQVILGENSIPNIVLKIDVHNFASPNFATQRVVTVRALTVEDYLNAYNNFQNYCDSREKADFYCEITYTDSTSGAESIKYTIDIKDWLCTSSGFNNVSAAGQVSFGITISHPIFTLSTASSYLYDINTINTTLLQKNLSKTQTPYAGLLAGLDLYLLLSSGSAVSSQTLAPQRDLLLARYTEAINVLKDNILDTCTQYPYASTTFFRNIQKEVWSYVSSFTEQNPWNFLVNKFLPDWLLSLKPDYGKDTKLQISPFNPWEAPFYLVDVKNVTGMQLPNDEIEPIAGIYAANYWGIVAAASACVPSDNKATVEGMSYIEASAKGMLQRTNLPTWFDNAFYNVPVASAHDTNNQSSAGGTAGGANSAPVIARTKINAYSQVILSIVKDLFFGKYKQANGVSVLARFMPNYSEGVKFLPGKVCSLISNDKELLRFYLTQVIHSVDVSNRTASTELSGRYVRIAGFKILDGTASDRTVSSYNFTL